VTLEMGKLIGESGQEAELSSAILRYYGEEGPRLAAVHPLDTAAGDAVLVNEPTGTLLGVEPWNYPLYQVVRLAAPNLVLGNTILLKHAGICPQPVLALEELFRDDGAPGRRGRLHEPLHRDRRHPARDRERSCKACR